MVKFLDLKKVTSAHGDEISSAVSRVVNSGWYLHGPETEAFEREYARFIGVSECVTCGNGLDALTLMLRALIEQGRLSPGDDVLVPANTFIATILAITEAGLNPVPVEPDIDTLEIDPARLEEAITPRCRALMTVHLYGRCAFSEQIADFCRHHNLILLEDNAQAHGCIYTDTPASRNALQKRRTGSLGLAAAHSFYPGKNLGALGDAGAVTTDDPELARIVRMLGNYGSEKKYVFDLAGRNSRMDEIQAAVLRTKLRHLDADNDLRRSIARIYYDRISNPAVRIPATPDMDANVFHLFPLLADNRHALQRHLADAGVETLIHYPIAPHRQKCYTGEPWASQPLPVTETIHATELSLPISPVLTPEEAAKVADAVNSCPG